ncbi:hypothetical protein D3C76_746470 [compost metagenome]
MEQPRQQPAAGQQQAEKQEGSLGQGQRQCPVPGLPAVAGKHRHQGQKQYCHNILEQQHTDGVLAVAAEDFTQAGKLLADDGCGGERKAGSQQQGNIGRHA